MQIHGTLKQNCIFSNLLSLLGFAQTPWADREKLFLKVQIEMLRERVDLTKIPTKPEEREVLLELGIPLGERVKDLIHIVQYGTYQGWINNRTKDISVRPHPFQRKIRRNTREIVLQIARQTHWGYNQIRGELIKLRLKASKTTVKNILKENNLPIASVRKNNAWIDSLKRHFKTLYACDFFSQEIQTPLGKELRHILFFINIKTRKVYIAGLTKSPTQSWVYNQVQEIIPLLAKDKHGKVLLFRDRDSKYPKRLDRLLRQSGISVKVLPRRSPNLNAYAESWVNRVRDDCLNYFIIFGESHLRYLIQEYVKYHNTVRPHSGLKHRCIDHSPNKSSGILRSKEILGGLHRHYYWG